MFCGEGEWSAKCAAMACGGPAIAFISPQGASPALVHSVQTSSSTTPESTLVPQFLKNIAGARGFEVSDCLYGSIHLGRSFPIEQSCGAVYGICAKAPTPLRKDMRALPGYADGYPVYWGKDISPVSRLKAHVQGHRNGNIHLPSILELANLPLVFGAVMVSSYEKFERLLHTEYPPLRGTPRSGRAVSVVKVRGGA